MPKTQTINFDCKDLATEVAKILNNQTSTMSPLRPEEFLPTFGGNPEEEPEEFIEAMEDYFTTMALPESHKLVITSRQFRATANKWYKSSTIRDKTIVQLWDRIRDEYGTHQNMDMLQETFYNRSYNHHKEDIEAFINKQQCLYHRFSAVKDEEHLVSRLYRQMPTEIRPYLISAKCKTIREFVKTAKAITKSCPELFNKEVKRSGNWQRAEGTSPPRSRPDATN